MDRHQKLVQSILLGMEEIEVLDPRSRVAVGAMIFDSLEIPILIAVGRKGRIRYCLIEEGVEPFILVAAVASFFGPSEIVTINWAPLHVSEVRDLTTECMEEYLQALMREIRINKAPEEDFRSLLDWLSTLEAQAFASKVGISGLSVVFREFSRKN